MEGIEKEPLLQKSPTYSTLKDPGSASGAGSYLAIIKETLKTIESNPSIPMSQFDGLAFELFNDDRNIISTTFSENSKYLGISWDDGSIWVWNLSLCKQQVIIRETQNSYLSFSEDASRLACRLDSSSLKIYEMADISRFTEFPSAKSKKNFSFVPKTRGKIAFVDEEDHVSILDIEKNEIFKNTSHKFSNTLIFEKTGNVLAFVTKDSQCVVLKTYDLTEIFKAGGTSIDFNPVEKYCILCSEHIGHDWGFGTSIFKQWNYKTGKLVSSYQFTNDIGCSYWFNQHGSFCIRDDGSIRFDISDHKGIHCASGGSNIIKIVNLETFKDEFSFENKTINRVKGYNKTLKFSPDDEIILLEFQNIVKIYNFRSNLEIFDISIRSGSSKTLIDFSKDSRFVLLNGSLIDITKKEKKRILEDSEKLIFHRFSDDLSKIGFVSDTGEILVWALNEERFIFKYQENIQKITYYASLSSNFKYLWIGGDQTAIINLLNPSDKFLMNEFSGTFCFNKTNELLCIVTRKLDVNSNSLKLINLVREYQTEILHNNLRELNNRISILFMNNDRNVLTHTGNQVLSIEIETKTCIFKISTIECPNSLCLTLDEKLLSITDFFGNFDIWDMKEMKKVLSTKINNQSSGSQTYYSFFTADGSKVIMSYYECLKILDISCSGSIKRSFNSEKKKILDELEMKDMIDAFCDSLITEKTARNKYSEIYQKNRYDIYLYYNTLCLISSSAYSSIPNQCYSYEIGKEKFTPIHFAAFKGETEFLKTLLMKEHNLMFYRDETGRSPIFYSIQGKHQTITDCFLQNFINFAEKAEFLLFYDKFSSIRLDLPYIIINSSPFLCDFLESCFYDRSKVYFGKRESSAKFSSTYFENFSDFCSLEEVSDIDQEPLKLKISGMKLPSIVGSSDSIELLKSILSTPNRDIYYVQLINSYINYKWEEVVSWIYFFSLLIWLNIIFVALCLGNYDFIYQLAFSISFCVINLLLLCWEVVQIINSKTDYMKDYWNFIDIIKLLTSFIWIVLNLLMIRNNIFDWSIVLLCILRGLTGFRAFHLTRYYIQLIVQSLNNVKSFLIIFGYTTISFGMLNRAISGGNQGLSFENLWIQPFGMVIGDIESMKSEELSIKYINFLIAIVLNIILMLNMIISILGDSFDEFQLNSVYYDGKEMTQVILEVEVIKSFYQRISEQKYLHICCNAYQNSEKQWQGKVIDLRSYIKETLEKYRQENEKVLADKISGLENSINDLKNEFNKNLSTTVKTNEIKEQHKVLVDEIEKKIEVIGRNNSELENKLQMILEKVSSS